jgi:hypothetical protein
MKSKNFYTGNSITMDQLRTLAARIETLTSGHGHYIQRIPGSGVRLACQCVPSYPLGRELLSKNILYIQLWAFIEGLERGGKLSS